MFKFIKTYRELKWLAYHDSLTKLLNRNWLYKNINKLKFEYIYFIDINNLKEVNKQGHTFGDNYIKKFVKSVNCDKSDIFIRYAGDEFIILSNTKNKFKTNKVYSVGVSKIINDLKTSINLADTDMLKSKLLWKSNRLT